MEFTEPVCDMAQTCSGHSKCCPDDLKADMAVLCREAKGSCDKAEYCSGENDSCPLDEKVAD
eukprot:3173408-Rhodomonas_salina.2